MLRQISVLTAALALLTACGGVEPAAPAPTGQDSPVSAVSKDAAIAAELPPEIVSAGKIGSNIQNRSSSDWPALVDQKKPDGVR